MIHYFNPGHETAVLHASKHYQPAANQVKMQQELAFLPAWYAQANDCVWMEEELTDAFRKDIQDLDFHVKTITVHQLEEKRNELSNQGIELWGISPQSIYRFEKINKQYDFQWQIPVWKDELRRLGSRFTAYDVLADLMEGFPDLDKTLLPKFVGEMSGIEEYRDSHPGRCLVKSPFSSSGRGLVWLLPEVLPRSERQIISGMLKKQLQVSIEKVLDKVLDFSMQFEIDAEQHIRFIGYSIFQTNEKGAYKNNLLAAQEVLEQQITAFIDKEYLLSVRKKLLIILQAIYTPYYIGNIGVDMLVYRKNNAYCLHPCVEINMRKNMGFLAIALQHNYLHSENQGYFQIDYDASPDEIIKKQSFLKKQHPIVFENGRMVSGYLSLCPVTDTSTYYAYLVCKKSPKIVSL